MVMTRKTRFVAHRKRFLRKWMDYVRAQLRINRAQLAEMLGVSESSINVTIYAMSGNVPTHVTVCRYALTLHRGMKNAEQLTQQTLEAYSVALLKDIMEEDAAGIEPKCRTRFKQETENEQDDNSERADQGTDATTADGETGTGTGTGSEEATTVAEETQVAGDSQDIITITLPEPDPVQLPWETGRDR